MGIRFFKIVGLVSYVAAFLALLAAIGLAVLSAESFMGHVDETVKQPKPALDAFVQKQKAEQAQQPAEEGAAESPLEDTETKEKDKAFQAKLTPVLKRIVSALDKYASLTNQGSVNPKGLEEYFIKNTEDLDREHYLAFLSSLAEESETLASRGEQIARLPDTDPGHLKWDQFIAWYVSAYMEQWQEEKNRITQEQAEQAAGRVKALTLLAAAGSAFVVFVFFTMILLLVKIEENTRLTHQAAAALQEPSTKTEVNTRATALALRAKPAASQAPSA